MGVSSASTDRYSDPQFVARYLESEWGDFLSQHAELPVPSSSALFPPSSSRFYKEVADFVQDLVSKQRTNPHRVCDIGCATGRFLYEVSFRLEQVTEFLGVEPSDALSSYARMFLIDQVVRSPLWVPFPDLPAGPTYVKLDDGFFGALNLNEEKRKRFEIFTGMGEDAPRSSGYFDVLFCLNVVDRHPNPQQLLNALKRFVRDDGLLFLASPMEWKKEFTPQEFWVNDLKNYLTEPEWEAIGETDVSYPFRATARYSPTFVSQVVCFKKN